MACRLDDTKPLSEPVLEYCNWTLRNKLLWNLNQNSWIFIQENAVKNVVCEIVAILSRGRWVKEMVHTLCHKLFPFWRSSGVTRGSVTKALLDNFLIKENYGFVKYPAIQVTRKPVTAVRQHNYCESLWHICHEGIICICICHHINSLAPGRS